MSDKKKLKIQTGIVTSVANSQTVTVEVYRIKTNPLYNKKFNKSKKFRVHSADRKYKIGDQVEFVSCRPISKDKHFKVINS